MNLDLDRLPMRAARNIVAGVSISLIVALQAAAQEEAATAPTAESEPAEAIASPAEESASEGQAATETVETIPVEATAEGEDANVAEPAAAAEGAAKLDAIEVTGSRLKRTDFESANPVLMVKREDIERTGLTSIGDLLQDLPVAGAAFNTLLNNGGDGATEVDLRNLGSERVLVLVNGKRWIGGVGSLRTGNVDLNTIPISIVERIEVLKDGASAVYGTDAIAGVVNIITRKNYIGSEVRTQWQTNDQGDAIDQAHSFAAGTVLGKTSVFIDFSYVLQQPIFAGDRDISSVPKFGTGVTRGSSGTPEGRFLFVPNQANGIQLGTGRCEDLTSSLVDPSLPPLPIPGGVQLCDLAKTPGNIGQSYSNYVKWDPSVHAYNYAPENYLQTPQERTGIFGQVGYQLTDDVRFSSELLYNMRKSRQLLAPMPLFVGDALPAPFNLAYVDETNPYNPFDQDIGHGDPAAGLVGLGAVLRRSVELGPRVFGQNVDTMRIGGGFDGNLDLLGHLFRWEVAVTATETRDAGTLAGLYDMRKVARALGPLDQCVTTTVEDPTGQVGDTRVAAPPDSAGCVPLNVFGGQGVDGLGTMTKEMLDYVTYTGASLTKQGQRAFYANTSTELGFFDAFLPGPVGLAVGTEYREEAFNSQPDPLVAAGTSSTNAATPTVGRYDVAEGFVELGIPVLEDLPFAQELELNLAARYSDYNRFGTNTSGKAGIRWKVMDDLLLRSTWSDSFRAPSITNLFLGRLTSFEQVTDPCSDYANSDNANVRENCADEVPSGYSQTNTQIASVFGGNPDTEPETATTLSAGLVYSPSWLQNLNVYLDWYSIELDNFIDVPGVGSILSLCYESDPSNRSLCEFVHRTPSGEIDNMENVFTNFSALKTEGIDFSADYLLPWFQGLGTFKLQMDASYLLKFNRFVPGANGDVVEERAGIGTGLGAYPKLKANMSLQYQAGPWQASWTTRYVGKVFEECDDGFQAAGVPSLEELGVCSEPDTKRSFGGVPWTAANELKATFYHNVQAAYNWAQWNTQVVLGANNVLGQEPRVSYNAIANSFDPTLNELEDIVPYIRLVTQFQ